jgi:hypothetical protein
MQSPSKTAHLKKGGSGIDKELKNSSTSFLGPDKNL